MRKLGKKLVSVFLAVAVAVTFIPVFGTQMASADTVSGTLLDEGELHGLKVRIRPTGSFKPLKASFSFPAKTCEGLFPMTSSRLRP